MNDRLNPLETARQIEGSYKRYLKTLLAPRNERLATAFDAEIDASTFLTNGPILEMTPPYETGATCRQLIDEGVLHPDFARIHGAAFSIDQPLYVHQETAIRKFVAGRNLVVSTGTGSGKTESFLLPIINSLIEESARGTLTPGVRALLLYPMNALANDQLKRMRGVLAGLPEITFGRYTGETPKDFRAAEAEFLQRNPTEQRLPNELLSRDEMRSTPPHLLLTNYAMLEYLLLRPADMELFDGQHGGNWRFIVMDEAHVYDGAQGSEVALLIRRLKQRVASDATLQCIATSASLTGSVSGDPRREAMTFARNLFDAPFEYHDGDVNRQDLIEPIRKKHLPTPDWRLTGEQLLALRSRTTRLEDVVPAGLEPAESLHREASMVELKDELSTGPVDVRTLREKIWPGVEHSAELLDALVELGSRVRDESGHPVLSARYHLFVRATEGAFVSFNDDGPRIFLSRHEVDPDTGRVVFEFGTCNRCGAVHLAGNVVRRDGCEYFQPWKKADASVNWLVLADSDGEVVIDEDELTLSETGKSTQLDPTTRRLCTGCGALLEPHVTACQSASCEGADLLVVREHPRAKRVMERCTECGTQARQAIRRLRTDVNAAPAVVTTALYQQLPEATGVTAEQVGGGRKLLMFSDSRQAAAFAAPYLDRTYTRMLERRYIVQALSDTASAGSDLTVGDLAILTREKAQAAGHFPRSAGNIEIAQAVNQWVSGELMTLETRQSLEGLGLMRVALRRDAQLPMRGFIELGLSEDEGWALLNELVKTVRLQGAVTVLERVDIKDERFAPRNTRVRMRSTGSDHARQIISWSPSGTGTTNARMTFLQKVLAALNCETPAARVLEGCWKLLDSGGFLVADTDRGVGGHVFQLDHRQLTLTNSAECQWYQCETCRLLTAFSVRDVCPNSRCTGRLKPFKIPALDDDANHYRVMYQSMNTAPLTAREHTAQWDSKAAAEIQGDFVSGKVNVLSCSTTFELGVDVGDLQSVVMRNMPPKTANYVQRAGRAGRRAGAAALVVTYANRSAHDLAQYNDPRLMIAGKMRIPWIPVDNARIARRHAHSVAMAAYFRHCAERLDERWRTAGEFFLATDDKPSPASRVEEFLNPVPPEITEALRDALPRSVHAEVGVDDGSWVAQLVELLHAVEKELTEDVSEIENRIQESVKARKFSLSNRLEDTKRTIIGRDLLGFLANRNILPKYGFPVDTVELSTVHATDSVGRRLELARDLSLAIFDYAPGNQVVAGGRIWTSAGLKRRPGKELLRHRYRVCQTCGRFERGNFDAAAPCPSCGEPFKAAGTMVIPEFGFIAASETRDVGTTPPERRWHGGSYVETHGDDVGFYAWSGPGGLTVTARAGVRAWLAIVSDGTGDGFQLCGWCGWAQAAERGSRRKKHQRPDNGRECTGPIEKIALGHRYQSDIAEFTFDGVPFNRDTEANWWSALYAILEGASYALEISRDDIDGTLSWSPDQRRSIVIYDTVPGGAGAAKRIAENVGLVMEAAVRRIKGCDCGEETSCYGCLRTYRNARHHEQLSRRGVLNLLGG